MLDEGGEAVLSGFRAADSRVWMVWRRGGGKLGSPGGGGGGGREAGAGGSEVKREVRMAESRGVRRDILAVVVGCSDSWVFLIARCICDSAVCFW